MFVENNYSNLKYELLLLLAHKRVLKAFLKGTLIFSRYCSKIIFKLAIF